MMPRSWTPPRETRAAATSATFLTHTMVIARLNERSPQRPASATILCHFKRMSRMRIAKFTIGEVVRHRVFPFRGVIFDIDPVFNNTEAWYQSIPIEVRPHKDQPFYHLFAENADNSYIAYVSEQNLLPDTSGEPIRHPKVNQVFEFDGKGYRRRSAQLN
jgi:heat shock protein HspQ